MPGAPLLALFREVAFAAIAPVGSFITVERSLVTVPTSLCPTDGPGCTLALPSNHAIHSLRLSESVSHLLIKWRKVLTNKDFTNKSLFLKDLERSSF